MKCIHSRSLILPTLVFLLLLNAGVTTAEDYRHLFRSMQAQQQQRALWAERGIEYLEQQLKLLKRTRLDRKQKLRLEKELEAQLTLARAELTELVTKPIPFTPTLNVAALHPNRYVNAGTLVSAEGKPVQARVIDWLSPLPNSDRKGILHLRCEGQLLSIHDLSDDDVEGFKPGQMVTLNHVFQCHAITLGGQEFQGKVYSGLSFNGIDLIPNKQPIYHLRPIDLTSLREQLAKHAGEQ